MEEEIIKEEIINVPNFFKDRYLNQNEDFEARKIIKKALRVNTLKIDEKELVKILKDKGVRLNKIDFLDHGYEFESDFSMGSTPEYLKGYYYLQEAASQVPVNVLGAMPEETILDMSAAPGGKTTQIAEYMKNRGVLVAIDSTSQRIPSLKNNIERMGVRNSIVYLKDARFAGDLRISFDRILLDAPCSGNYCVENDWFLKRTKQDFDNKAGVQKQLIGEAFQMLKKGGVLVYSTCSLEKEEDEDVIEWALDTFEFELVDMKLKSGTPGCTKKTGLTRKFWPYITGTQGFYVAKLKKK